jgi:hypothetical protein
VSEQNATLVLSNKITAYKIRLLPLKKEVIKSVIQRTDNTMVKHLKIPKELPEAVTPLVSSSV